MNWILKADQHYTNFTKKSFALWTFIAQYGILHADEKRGTLLFPEVNRSKAEGEEIQ